MSQPQISQNMYYIEGQTIAVLVTTKSGKRTVDHVWHPTPGRALAWCRKHRAGFVYQPAVPNN
jgi:hypothetical protein